MRSPVAWVMCRLEIASIPAHPVPALGYVHLRAGRVAIGVPIISGSKNAILDMSAPRVLCDGLFRGAIDLHELGVELSDLLLSPDRRTEAVMADRRHHEEPGVARVESFVQPVRPLHVLTSPSNDGIRDYS